MRTPKAISQWIILATLIAVLTALTPLFSQESQKEQRQGILVEKKVMIPDSLIPRYFKGIYDAARVESNWNKLKKGMTKEDVFGLLGFPSKGGGYQKLDASETWTYGKHYIEFNSVTERVRYWE